MTEGKRCPMRRLWSAVVAATLVVSILQGSTATARTGSGGNAFYLALGASVATGFQPGVGETPKGYVDDLWRRMQQEITGLRHRNVACSGETSRSMITGTHSPCQYGAGSQLDAAVSFLEAHPGDVAFITIDIGSNDMVNHCYSPRTGVIDKDCAVDLRPRLQTRLTHILDELATAADPGVPIVGMTYYNPFLGYWHLIPGGHAVARADQRAWSVFNTGLATAYAGGGATVADVSATFRIDDFKHTVKVPGQGRLPVNVALACKWTWFCARRFLGDPHPNRKGHSKIARTFSRELQDLLP